MSPSGISLQEITPVLGTGKLRHSFSKRLVRGQSRPQMKPLQLCSCPRASGQAGQGLPCSHCRDPMHGASSKKPSAWVGSLPCLREPCGTRDAETIASVVPELALSERVPPRGARSVIRLPAGHWKMDVLFIFVQAVNSTAIWLHEFTSLAAE